MVKFLIHRPIAVFLSFLGIILFSVLAIKELPVSLLPNIEVPSVVIKVDYPNNPPEIIENGILKSIRTELNSLNNLKSIESSARSETGLIKLEFEYGTQMDLAYIEINEKIDRLQELLPRDIDRPRVIRINTSDIPILRIQVTPRAGTDYVGLSELAERVLKKRLEQLPGVSVVDLNGFQEQFISIAPNTEQIKALNIDESQIEAVLKGANQELGQLSVRDGQYRYFVRVANRLDNLDEIKKLPVTTKTGDVLSLDRLAKIDFAVEKILGYHLYNEEQGMVITVHKQSSAKMTELVPLLYDAVELFKEDYPEATFDITQDQSLLLNAGINNLTSSLVYGGAFAFAVLFLFMGNLRMPLIMGLTLPISLIISFLLFYATGLSINIISLSGLALGLGMLIDNAIIVIDNITRKRKSGLGLIEACTSGVNEVMAPLISSVLTTLAVFIPLIFLNGLSGSLFYDQALSVAIILGTSLMVAFVLLPLLYRVFFSKVKKPVKEDSIVFLFILKVYKGIYKLVWRFRTLSFLLLLLLVPTAYFLIDQMEKSGLPDIEKTETLIKVSWNEPISAESNKARVSEFLSQMDTSIVSEAEVGLKQFLLSTEEGNVQQAEIYLKFNNMQEKFEKEAWISGYFDQRFPQASYNITDAPNAFDQIFSSEKRFFIAKWKDLSRQELLDEAAMEELMKATQGQTESSPLPGGGFLFEESLEAVIDNEALSVYGISESAFKDGLSKALGGYLVTEVRRFGEVTPVRIERPSADFRSQLAQVELSGPKGQKYPISQFVKIQFAKNQKNITADRSGIYQSFEWEAIEEEEIQKLMEQLPAVAGRSGLVVNFGGAYFEGLENLRQLIFILAISVALLYFILAAQFESLVQPLIVIFTLPLGISGALLVLVLTGGTLNVMSAIGIIVMLGIMVNDAILKIDTINRQRNELKNTTDQLSIKEILTQSIAKTGEIRLKPILMTSITTILALLPVVFSSGLGADLQRPLVFSVIGGLTIGTFTALFFVPLAYWFVSKKS